MKTRKVLMENLKNTIYNFYLQYKKDSFYLELIKLLESYFAFRTPNYTTIHRIMQEIEKNTKKIVVTQALLQVSFGEIETYTAFTKRFELGRGVRSVATLIGKNPLPIIIPCHRIIRKDRAGGYIFGEENKKKLIEFEKQAKSQLSSFS